MGDAIVQGYLGETPEQQDAILQGRSSARRSTQGRHRGRVRREPGGPSHPGLAGQGRRRGRRLRLQGRGRRPRREAGRGAAGGGLYGLGSAINEDTLGEPLHRSGEAGHHPGSGLIGAGVNAITHGAFKASESALTKVAGSSSLREWLDSLANKLYEKQMASASVENANNLTREEVHSIFQNNKGLFSPLDTHASVAKKAAQAREWAGQEMGAALERAGNWFNPTGSRCVSRRTSPTNYATTLTQPRM